MVHHNTCTIHMTIHYKGIHQYNTTLDTQYNNVTAKHNHKSYIKSHKCNTSLYYVYMLTQTVYVYVSNYQKCMCVCKTLSKIDLKWQSTPVTIFYEPVYAVTPCCHYVNKLVHVHPVDLDLNLVWVWLGGVKYQLWLKIFIKVQLPQVYKFTYTKCHY